MVFPRVGRKRAGVRRERIGPLSGRPGVVGRNNHRNVADVADGKTVRPDQDASRASHRLEFHPDPVEPVFRPKDEKKGLKLVAGREDAHALGGQGWRWIILHDLIGAFGPPD